jgi:hypothetical protein
MRLAVSNGPSGVGVSALSPGEGHRSNFHNVVLSNDVLRIREHGQSPKNLVNPSIIRHLQNSLKFTIVRQPLAV